MTQEKILHLFKRNDLAPENTVLEENFDDEYGSDINEMILPILDELIEDNLIMFPETDGGWVEGELVNEIASVIDEIIEKAQGRITITELKLVPPQNESDSEEEMSISFRHNNKLYEWTFSHNERHLFYTGVAKWAYSSLNGGLVFAYEDYPWACILPPNVVKELESLGLKKADSW